MYERAIQDLHETKMSEIEVFIQEEKYNALIEAIQVCCLAGMILILA